MNTVMAAVG